MAAESIEVDELQAISSLRKVMGSAHLHIACLNTVFFKIYANP